MTFLVMNWQDHFFSGKLLSKDAFPGKNLKVDLISHPTEPLGLVNISVMAFAILHFEQCCQSSMLVLKVHKVRTVSYSMFCQCPIMYASG